MEKERPNSTILVVDDEALLRMNASEVLEDAGYTVLECATADEALKIMDTYPSVQVLFTDIHMPGSLDGVELARLVHAQWPAVKLIITSAKSKLNKAEIPDDGAFITKPYTDDQLISTVQDQLKDVDV